MEDMSHKRAWEILKSVPEGQKNAFLVEVILKSFDEDHLKNLIRDILREELKNIQIPVSEKPEGSSEEIPAQMLDFLASMEDTV